jgi:hypothetical protein
VASRTAAARPDDAQAWGDWLSGAIPAASGTAEVDSEWYHRSGGSCLAADSLHRNRVYTHVNEEKLSTMPSWKRPITFQGHINWFYTGFN